MRVNVLAWNSIKENIWKIPVIFWGLVIVIMILGIVSPNSIRPNNMLNFTRQAAPLIVVGLGQMIVMMIGGLDLSVAGIVIFVNIIAAKQMANNPANIASGVIMCLATGILIGLVNGILTSKFKLSAFVVTLAMSILLLGITMIYCGGAPVGSIPAEFRVIGNGFTGSIPNAAIVWMFVAVCVGVLLKITPFGRYLLSVGVNPFAAYQSGVNYEAVQISAYVLCGFLSAIGGLQVAAYIGTGTFELGTDYQMLSIAVAILGGSVFAGGKGSIVGTIIASLFMMVTFSLVAALRMGAGEQKIVMGVIILAALIINTFKKD